MKYKKLLMGLQFINVSDACKGKKEPQIVKPRGIQIEE